MLSTTLKRTAAASVVAVLLGGATVGMVSAQGAPATPWPGQTPGAATTPAARPSAEAGEHGHGEGHEHGNGYERGVALGIAAEAIGITPQQLRNELPGHSLAQVAQAHGKRPEDVATALKNAAHARMDQEVAEGKLTPDEAAQRKQMVDQRIDQMLNQVVPAEEATPTGGTPAPAAPAGATTTTSATPTSVVTTVPTATSVATAVPSATSVATALPTATTAATAVPTATSVVTTAPAPY